MDFAAQAPGNGGHQTVGLGKDRGFAGVHEHEAAGAEVFFASPAPKQVCPKSAACWSPAAPAILISPPKCMGRHTRKIAVGHRLWQHIPGNIQNLQDLIVPVQRVDVEQHRPAGVGVIRYMDLAAGQLPDQPGFHRAEKQFPCPGLLPGAFHIVRIHQFGAEKYASITRPVFLAELFVRPRLSVRRSIRWCGGTAIQ